MTNVPGTTPGVYIQEQGAFPNSVVEVPTAVPAFIGYTAYARSGTTDLTFKPVRITSMVEYLALYANPPSALPAPPLNGTIAFQDSSEVDLVSANKYLLYRSLQFFYANGGGPCWIVSIGDYTQDPSSADYVKALATLESEPEPTMIVTPGAVLLGNSDWEKVAAAALAHCDKMMSRVAILDVWGGNLPSSPTDDHIEAFRTSIGEPAGSNPLSYGVAYWPWLNTSIIEASEVMYTALADKVRSKLADEMTQEAGGSPGDALEEMIAKVKSGTPTAQVEEATHQALLTASPVYRSTMTRALAAANLMPPSPAMAGIYTATDAAVGVWKAPANVSVNSVVSPAVKIDDAEQENLNVPLDGKAVNAIRTFLGRGILVWGARTLDGNSQDWRYVNVRRTLIMLEQSIKAAVEAYVFAPNDASTWVTVDAMIENFLDNQWKAGALAGSSPAEAYQVSVGLGSTMTGTDILDGYMRVTVKVAVVHPAEFVVLTFQQEMHSS